MKEYPLLKNKPILLLLILNENVRFQEISQKYILYETKISTKYFNFYIKCYFIEILRDASISEKGELKIFYFWIQIKTSINTFWVFRLKSGRRQILFYDPFNITKLKISLLYFELFFINSIYFLNIFNLHMMAFLSIYFIDLSKFGIIFAI